jgi:hypothetical protein
MAVHVGSPVKLSAKSKPVRKLVCEEAKRERLGRRRGTCACPERLEERDDYAQEKQEEHEEQEELKVQVDPREQEKERPDEQGAEQEGWGHDGGLKNNR